MLVAFSASRSSALADCRSSAGTVCGTIPCEAGKKNERGDRPDERDHGELPDLGVPRDEEVGRDRLREAGDEVRRNHHEVAREPVGDDATDEEEEDLRQDRERQDEAELGWRAADAEHGERERHGRHRRACE